MQTEHVDEPNPAVWESLTRANRPERLRGRKDSRLQESVLDADDQGKAAGDPHAKSARSVPWSSATSATETTWRTMPASTLSSSEKVLSSHDIEAHILGSKSSAPAARPDGTSTSRCSATRRRPSSTTWPAGSAAASAPRRTAARRRPCCSLRRAEVTRSGDLRRASSATSQPPRPRSARSSGGRTVFYSAARAKACVSMYSRILVSLPSRTVMAKIQWSSKGAPGCESARPIGSCWR